MKLNPALQRLINEITRRREFILYVIFGALTSLVSIISFALMNRVIGANEHLSNVVSWILAVTFAFLTNRAWVFPQKWTGWSGFLMQGAKFYAGRLFTLAVEEVILYVFVTRLQWDSLIVKAVAQVIVIALNYIISKLIVFRKARG